MDLRGARVVVTGGTGFLGSHVATALWRRNVHAVEALSHYDDLRHDHVADHIFMHVRPDLVVHLAARVGGIGANAAYPAKFFRDNMAMGMNVLEAARRHSVKKLLIVGTACSYPANAPMPLREESLWDGYPAAATAPYGVAKKALLVMAQAYREEYGLNTVFAIPSNLYGPGDHFDLERGHVVPAMIRRFVEARERGDTVVTLWGDGTPTRDFLYVADAAEGLCRLAETYDDPAPVNLGTGFETSMWSLADVVDDAVGYQGDVRWDASRPNGTARRALDTTRMRQATGWSSTTWLGDGIRETVEWYLSHRGSETNERKA